MAPAHRIGDAFTTPAAAPVRESAPASRARPVLKLRLSFPSWLDGIENRKSTWIIVGVLGVVAVVTAWLLGGFKAAPTQALPSLEAGKAVDTGQWRVVVHGATLSAKRPDGRDVPAGKAALAIELELTNRTKASSNDTASVIRLSLPAIPPKTQPDMFLLRDRTILGPLHPGMPERVALSWDIPLGSAIPDPLPVVVISKIHKERDNLIGGSGWFNPKPLVEVKLAVASPDGAAPAAAAVKP